ncbi:MAG: hypothetical protein LBK26_00975 [Rickettsiales bacterium]|jgi:hypothetical protein|nr:hypothetical protein [Rickettsiales bacterium]
MKKISLLVAVCSLLFIAGCAGNAPYNEDDFAAGGPDAPLLNERTMQFMQPDNLYSDADTFRPKTVQEKTEMSDKWDTSRMETRWQEYKGTMVRVQILLGSTDLREIRLKLVQNANGTDIDANNREVLGRVADFEMKKICGRNSDSYVMIYDRPSFEVLRPTPYFDYVSQNEGTAMREYGFRCIYR